MKNIGSTWHRWDLHFHTQTSYDYGDKSVTDDDIINVMHQNGISAFAITDHHVIDIDRLKSLQEKGNKAGICVLPGIEFLADARGDEPIHFIGIFSELCNINHVWEQIKNKTAIERIYRDGNHPNSIYCDLTDTIKLIKDLGGIVSIHAGKKSNSIENITNSLPHAIAQKIDIAQKVDIYELGKSTDQDGYRKIVFPSIGKDIPMIICSDNHNIKKYVIKEKLWIKGSPCFEGLRYALNEPEERFFIGDEPAITQRVRNNKTKYIKNLSIKSTGASDPKNIWFNNIEIPLSTELVTIIGNKGSGKSAIGDIIALFADNEHFLEFTFLNKERFNKKGFADKFFGTLTFHDGKTTEEKTLDHKTDPNKSQLVKYLPQSYFEKICNEIGKIENLRSEIEKVVFQYVPIPKRLNRENFPDLISAKKQAIDLEIRELIDQIYIINDKIIALEDKSDPNYKKQLLNKKIQKDKELQAHITSKPLSPPTENTHENVALSELRRKQGQLLAEELNIQKLVSNLYLIQENSKIIHREIISKIAETNKFVTEKIHQLQAILACATDLSFSVNFNDTAITNKLASIATEINLNEKKLTASPMPADQLSDDLPLKEKIRICSNNISTIERALSTSERNHQKYISLLSEWEKKYTEINGDIATPETIEYIDNMIKYIEEYLPGELIEARLNRINLATNIYTKKLEIKNIYDDIKEEINKQLSDDKVEQISITSSFYIANDFEQKVLQNIKKNRSGSFYGVDEGATILRDSLIQPTDWNNLEHVTNFLHQFIEYLEYDKRTPNQPQASTHIGHIVSNRSDLYNYLFSLAYLEPYYDLQQGTKTLEQLSPGEKGALLLVFYLVLDKEDVPLIIDQPEDNLDNNSVATILVPFIRKAKKKRQIIMITHNPNLAVVADSEQVIRVDIQKSNGNTFIYTSGGIEDGIIKKQIVDVLEGTERAFTIRKDKYKFIN